MVILDLKVSRNDVFVTTVIRGNNACDWEKRLVGWLVVLGLTAL